MPSLVVECATLISQAAISQAEPDKIKIAYISLNQSLYVFEEGEIDLVKCSTFALNAQLE